MMLLPVADYGELPDLSKLVQITISLLLGMAPRLSDGAQC